MSHGLASIFAGQDDANDLHLAMMDIRLPGPKHSGLSENIVGSAYKALPLRHRPAKIEVGILLNCWLPQLRRPLYDDDDRKKNRGNACQSVALGSA